MTDTPHDPGPRPMARDRSQPLWMQIRDDLRRRLEAGAFDDSFPGELALVDQYAVSRHTVRDALSQLRRDGVVLAERGRPPRLAQNQAIEQPLGALYSLFASVEVAGQVQRSIVRKLDVRADGVVAARLGLEESTPLLHLERLRLADEEPLAVDRAWLPATLTAPLLDADFTRTALYGELRDRCGIALTGGGEYIRAVIPSQAERHLLDVGAGVAAFAIDRTGRWGQRPVEWRHTLVRADRFAVVAEFAASTGYRLDVTQLAGAAGSSR